MAEVLVALLFGVEIQLRATAPCIQLVMAGMDWVVIKADRFGGRSIQPIPAVASFSAVSASAEYHSAMQVATGTVVNGKIVVEGVPLQDGALVAVVARGADESFTLSAEQEEELLSAMAEIERGEFVTLEQLLAELPQ